eukprot:TRINITY_DN29631_c0_g1_i1.p1 TRINITY_DN29631_c0_g1~~TRINITY_DN29631_c0_g1_i1.p1  ORF type:complete len:217 (-),score=48.79 TRINITY_DN29631_c0_g1_i1:194-844(-)
MAEKPNFSLGVSGLLDDLEARLTPPGSPQNGKAPVAAANRRGGNSQQRGQEHGRGGALPQIAEHSRPAPWESFQKKQIAAFMRDVDECLEYMGELEEESKRRVEALLHEPDYRLFAGSSYLGEEESELEDPNASQLIVEGFALLSARDKGAGGSSSSSSSEEPLGGHHGGAHGGRCTRGSPRCVPNMPKVVGDSYMDFGSTCDDSMSGLLDTSAYY